MAIGVIDFGAFEDRSRDRNQLFLVFIKQEAICACCHRQIRRCQVVERGGRRRRRRRRRRSRNRGRGRGTRRSGVRDRDRGRDRSQNKYKHREDLAERQYCIYGALAKAIVWIPSVPRNLDEDGNGAGKRNREMSKRKLGLTGAGQARRLERLVEGGPEPL